MNTVSRRQFIKNSAIVAGMTVGSSRILGANDRLSIGVIGCSERARSALMKQVVGLGKPCNVDITAVCDLWSVNREKGAKLVTDSGAKAPRQYKYMDELLALKDIDAVIIATGDFQHAPLLKIAVEAGKDCYCEKPMAIDIESAKAAYKAVLLSGRIVQIGTQGISAPASRGARETIASGVLGGVSMVDAYQSYWGPRWRHRGEPALLQEKDTDWKAWLLDRPYRPFDPHLYFEYRIYRGFGVGIAGQWMSHIVAEQANIMNVTFPKSVSCKDNTYIWKDGRQFGDTFQATVTYDNYMFAYRCTFGNNYPGHIRYYGENGTMEMAAGGYKVSGLGGGDAATPENVAHEKASREKGEGYRCNPKKIDKEFMVDSSQKYEGDGDHMRNWLDGVRSRKQPNASVLSGYAHSVVCVMCDRSDQLGREVYWDMEKQEIVDSPVAP